MTKPEAVLLMRRLVVIPVVVSGMCCTSSPPVPKPGAAPSSPTSANPTKAPDVAKEGTVEARSTAGPVAAESDSKLSEQPVGTAAESSAMEATPLDLSKIYTMPAASFEKVTRYPWKIVPRGTQTFANIPLELGGAMFLWGERNAKNGMVYPERIEAVPVNKSFETLYIYHSGFFEGKEGEVVYDVVFQYEDGASASEHIVNGEDLRDWYVNDPKSVLQPSGPRSTLAWSGADEKGQVVRYCLTAVQNPHPTTAVKSLDFVSAKGQTAGCILGLTVGKSGLLKIADKNARADLPQ